MGFTRQLLSDIGNGILSRSASFAGRPLTDPALGEWLGMGNETSSGVQVNAETAMRQTAVFRAVCILGQTVGALPLAVHERLGEHESRKAVDLSVYPLLHDSPNPRQTSMEWREMAQAHLALRGNSFNYIDTDNGGRIRHIWPLHPDRVRVLIDDQGGLVYEHTNDANEITLYRADEILHVKGLSLDGILGVSPITYAREAIGLSAAMETHAGNLYKNGTHTGGVITHPTRLGKESRSNLRQSVEEYKAGRKNAGGVLVLDEGMQFSRLGMTSQDAQFLESRKAQIPEVARMFGVPPHMLADLDRSTNNNIEQQSLEFVQHCIGPWIVRWEQRLNKSLFTRAERTRYYCKHNIKSLLRADSLTQARVLQIEAQNGVTSPDEWRSTLDRNPRPDGDGNTFSRPANMVVDSDDEGTAKATNNDS